MDGSFIWISGIYRIRSQYNGKRRFLQVCDESFTAGEIIGEKPGGSGFAALDIYKPAIVQYFV